MTVAVDLAPARPYPGIESYQYVDRGILVGRGSEVEKLLRYVTMYRTVLLFGDSGSGKSSLVNAGLVPAAIAAGFAPERIRVQPRRGEELVVERIPTREDGSSHLPSIFADHEPARAVLSVEAFRARLADAPADRDPLLIFDQFEEFSTLFEEAARRQGPEVARDVQAGVFDLLIDLALDSERSVKLLFVFREDYLAHLSGLLARIPGVREQGLRLLPLGLDRLEEIVRGPFERLPGVFARELSPAVARELAAQFRDDADLGRLSLSAVQIVCRTLWESDDPEGLLRARGVRGLLGDHLAEAIDALPEELRDPAALLLGRMVTSSGTRNVVSRDDLLRSSEDDEVPVDRLERALTALEADARVVRRERRRDVDVYEIVSEFLVPQIKQLRDQRAIRLERARVEREWQQRRTRAVKRLRTAALAIATVVLLVGVLVFGVLAYQLREQRDGAEQARAAEAQQRVQAERAEATAVASAAVAAQEKERAERAATDQAAQRQLAEAAATAAAQQRETAERNAAAARVAEATARATLLTLQRQDRQLLYTAGSILRAPSGAVFDATFSPDGQLVATAGEDGITRVWDLAAGRTIATLGGHTGRVYAATFAHRGTLIVTAGEDATARVWDGRTGRAVTVLRGHRDRVLGAAFSPDDRRIATGGADTTARVWDAATGELVRELRGHSRLVTSVAYGPDGRQLVSTSDDGTARIWDAASGEPVRTLGPLGAPTNAAAFSRGGRLFGVAVADGRARLWSPAGWQPVGELRAPRGRVTGIAFGSDDRIVATASDDGIPRIWSTESGELIAELRGHTDRAYSARFSPDGRRIVTTSRDGTARVWESSATNSAVIQVGNAATPSSGGKYGEAGERTPLQAGLEKLAQGDLDGAIEQCGAAIQRSPAAAEAYFCRGLAYDRRGGGEDNRRALADYEETLKRDPSHALARLERGLLNANVFRDCARAVGDLRQYLQAPVGGYESAARAALQTCSAG